MGTTEYPAGVWSGVRAAPNQAAAELAARQRAEQERAAAGRMLAREIQDMQRLAGTNTVSRRLTSWEPQQREVPGHVTEQRQQRGSDAIDWGRMDGSPVDPNVIVVDRVATTEQERRDARLSAELDAMKRNRPGRW
jgi:hypothetical protein